MVKLDEPSPKQAALIIRGLRPAYEKSHNVYVRDDAITAAAALSARYIAGRQLPDKAIDLMDEAASRLKMAVHSKPELLDTEERQLIQLKMEHEALKRDKNPQADKRLKTLEQDIQAREETVAQLAANWKEEKNQLLRLQDLKEKLDQARYDLEKAQREGNLTRAGELMYSTIPSLEKNLAEAEKKKEGNTTTNKRSRKAKRS